MILYPAIDLKDGQAVRLYKGEMDKVTVFMTIPPLRPWPLSTQAANGFISSTSTVPLPGLR